MWKYVIFILFWIAICNFLDFCQLKKKSQVFGKFLTFKCQLPEGQFAMHQLVHCCDISPDTMNGHISPSSSCTSELTRVSPTSSFHQLRQRPASGKTTPSDYFDTMLSKKLSQNPNYQLHIDQLESVMILTFFVSFVILFCRKEISTYFWLFEIDELIFVAWTINNYIALFERQLLEKYIFTYFF